MANRDAVAKGMVCKRRLRRGRLGKKANRRPRIIYYSIIKASIQDLCLGWRFLLYILGGVPIIFFII